jgi:hypothetical protein
MVSTLLGVLILVFRVCVRTRMRVCVRVRVRVWWTCVWKWILSPSVVVLVAYFLSFFVRLCLV